MDSFYKTGDLCKWLVDGNIEFLGRIDRQVKIRGFRIELAEIENRLSSLNSIKDAVVVDFERKSGDQFLAAYVVSEGQFDAAGIKVQLSQRLPDYMVPAYIVQIDAIPWTSIGKVDRKRLPRPDVRTTEIQAFESPKSRREKQLAKIWQEILEVEHIGLDDNFFDLGGSSLDIMKINSRIKEEFNIQVPVVAFFQHTTIRSLSHFLEEQSGNESIGLSEEQQREAEIMEAIEKSQERLRQQAGEDRTGLEIAVIGMSCKFPGVSNLTEYWDVLKNGRETIHFFTDEELVEDGMDAVMLQSPNYVKAKGIIDGVEYFDSGFFGYTPMEANLMDPQMRVFHENVWSALEDAGYNPYSYNRRIGLYAGASPNFSWEGLIHFSNSTQGLSGFMVAQLVNKDFMCTHISYKLNLKGPAVSIQTACSTSLVAIHYAVQGLLRGECEMALAGGVSISYPYKRGYMYQEGMIFSPDGHNRSFDAEGKGSLFSDGVGVVVLKPLPGALADGDHVYAVVKGTAVNNDGVRKAGYTAPSIQGQMEVIRGAQLNAGIKPESISYIEAHGTATPLGDTVEIEALKKAFNTDKKNYCAIGSVKSNMGHLYSAAGAAGFIKTVLALHRRMIPPTLHFNTPNPQIDFDNSPFYMNTRLRNWDTSEEPRRAGVSAFGIGGTNAHIILEEAPPQVSKNRAEPVRGFNLVLLSAKTPSALGKLTDNFICFIRENPGLDFADTAYTLQTGRRHLPYRRMLVASSKDIDVADDRINLVFQRSPIVMAKEEKRPVFFMFCGQGSQYADMGIDLYRTEPVFRQEMDRCFDLLKNLMGFDIKTILYPGLTENPEPDSNRIHQPEITLPIMFSFEYALAKLLESWGIRPDAMIGYSFGEYSAACLAGVFSLEDILRMIVIRGQLIQLTPEGKMSSVTLPEAELKPLLNDRVSISIVNGPTCIISGKKEDVEEFEQAMKQRRVISVPLNMGHAVHSPIMNPIRDTFEKKIREFVLHKPRIPFISNVTGYWADPEQATYPTYWGDHLCSTVRFSDGLKELLKEEKGIFIEIGPGRVLGMMARVHPDKKPGHFFLNTIKHPQERVSDDYFLLDKLGQYWLQGQTIDWAGFHGNEKHRRVPLPTYPFEGKRYWIDPSSVSLGGSAPITVSSQTETRTQIAGINPAQAGQGISLTPNGLNEPSLNPMEHEIAMTWKEMMGLDFVGVDDDFFSLNGSSLVATQIMARLMDTYKVPINLSRFYEKPTISHIAHLIREAQIENQNSNT